MTILRNTAEGGTVGVAPTVGNSGGSSGDAFTVVTAQGTSTITVDNAHTMHGTKAYKIVTGGTAESVLAGLAISPNATAGAAQCYLYMSAYPTTQTRLMQFTTGAGAGKDALSITSAGKLRWDSFAGTDVSMALSVPLNTWVRIAMLGNTTASEAHLFTDPDSTTAAESLTGLAALSGDTFAYVRFGWTSSSVGFTAWFDTVETNSAAVLPSPYVSIVSKADSDTAASADLASLVAALSESETAGSADAALPLAAVLLGADTAASADLASVAAALLGADTAGSADLASLTAALSGADTSASADLAVPLVAALSGADTAASADLASLAAALSGADTAASAEYARRLMSRVWRHLSFASTETHSGISAASGARQSIEQG